MNKETVRRASSFSESQEIKIRHDAFWGYDINDRLGAEVSVGYQGDDIDAFVFGASVSWSLDPHLSLAPMGEMNADGDYAVGISLVYDFGGSGNRSTLTHFASRDSDDFTPFRKRSFPLLLHGTSKKRRTFSRPDGGGSDGDVDTTGDDDNGDDDDDDDDDDHGDDDDGDDDDDDDDDDDGDDHGGDDRGGDDHGGDDRGGDDHGGDDDDRGGRGGRDDDDDDDHGGDDDHRG